jgi:hypothetical protein
MASAEWLDTKKDPVITKRNTSFRHQGTQTGKDGSVHIKVDHNLGMTSIIKGDHSTSLSIGNGPKGLILRASTSIRKAHTGETAMACSTLSGKKGRDRGNLRAWNKPKMEGTAQAGTVLLRISCAMRN